MSFIAPATEKGRKARQSAIRRNTGELELSVMVRNITETYKQATEHGSRSWYVDAHEIAVDLSIEHDITVRQACGVLAALSPSTSWERNIQLAQDLLEEGDCAHAYGDAIRKAKRIADGADPADVLGGRKVRSFYANLLRPTTPGAVTIDRHAYSIAMLGVADAHTGRTRTLSERELKGLARPGVYQLIAAAYRSVARTHGIAPHDLQSITWDFWRDTHAFNTNLTTERF